MSTAREEIERLIARRRDARAEAALAVEKFRRSVAEGAPDGVFHRREDRERAIGLKGAAEAAVCEADRVQGAIAAGLPALLPGLVALDRRFQAARQQLIAAAAEVGRDPGSEREARARAVWAQTRSPGWFVGEVDFQPGSDPEVALQKIAALESLVAEAEALVAAPKQLAFQPS